MKISICAVVIGLLLAYNANAEVVEKSSDHFLIAFSANVEASPDKVYAAIGAVAQWWSDEQTWSGSAENLSLKTDADSCFCERWAEGSAAHGRVTLALKNQLLRLDAALGLLQESALSGVLTFKLSPTDNDTTELDVSYRVSGSSASGLDQRAAHVDRVLAAQIDRLLRYIDTGDAEIVEVPAEAEPSSQREARAELIEEWGRQAAAKQAQLDGAKPKPKLEKPKPKAKQ